MYNVHFCRSCFLQVQRNTTDPVYKERFLFPVSPEMLDRTQAQFQVYSSDKYARHKLQGETEIRLGDIDLRTPIRVWMNLRDMDEVSLTKILAWISNYI